MANGKGDWRRPGDEEAYREHFDRIFGPRRGPSPISPAEEPTRGVDVLIDEAFAHRGLSDEERASLRDLVRTVRASAAPSAPTRETTQRGECGPALNDIPVRNAPIVHK